MPQRKGRKNQPKKMGVVRICKTAVLHGEVVQGIEDIAEREKKSFAYVVAEIVYAFFGLEVKKDVVKIARPRREKKTSKRNRTSSRRNVRRVAA